MGLQIAVRINPEIKNAFALSILSAATLTVTLYAAYSGYQTAGLLFCLLLLIGWACNLMPAKGVTGTMVAVLVLLLVTAGWLFSKTAINDWNWNYYFFTAGFLAPLGFAAMAEGSCSTYLIYMTIFMFGMPALFFVPFQLLSTVVDFFHGARSVPTKSLIFIFGLLITFASFFPYYLLTKAIDLSEKTGSKAVPVAKSAMVVVIVSAIILLADTILTLSGFCSIKTLLFYLRSILEGSSLINLGLSFVDNEPSLLIVLVIYVALVAGAVIALVMIPFEMWYITQRNKYLAAYQAERLDWKLIRAYPRLYCKLHLTRPSIRRRHLLFRTLQCRISPHCQSGFHNELRTLVGVIGPHSANNGFIIKGNDAFVALWHVEARSAHNADIDKLAIVGGASFDYDKVVNEVVNTLKNDSGRPSSWLRKIPVAVQGKPALSENTLKILKKEFASINFEA